MKPRKLVWTEGLFLTQHHFQQLDRYHEMLLETRLTSIFPFAWGVLDLAINPQSLGAGRLKLDRFMAILPDGSPVVIGQPGDDDNLPERGFQDAFPTGATSLDVYVALPQESQTTGNVELDGNPSSYRRYIREEVIVTDFSTGANEHPVPWARRNMRILFGDEPRDSFDTIRVARLVRAPSGGITLDATYLPPVLQIRASSLIMDRLRELLGVIKTKQKAVAATRQQRSDSAVEFEAGDASRFWFLHTLNERIPVFAHYLEEPSIHPRDLFLALSRFAGTLCTFAANADPSDLPAFNFLDLAPIFGRLFNSTLTLLNTVLSERHVAIPLTMRPDGVLEGRIDDPTIYHHTFYVTAIGSAPAEQLRERLPRLMKIASGARIQSLMDSSLNGVPVEIDNYPPGALPLKPGMVVFKVVREPDFWTDIIATGSVCIYHPLDPSTVTIGLYAVDPMSLT